MSDFTACLSSSGGFPPGRVATYGDVAAAAGQPGAARAVGNIMRDCRRRDVPCHRVVAAAGRLGGYGGNVGLKRALLRAEGVQVVGLDDPRFQHAPVRASPVTSCQAPRSAET